MLEAEDFSKPHEPGKLPPSTKPPKLIFPYATHYCASLDIETSGLEKENDFITCIGYLSNVNSYQSSNSWHKWNTDPLTAEAQTINSFVKNINDLVGKADVKTLVTYNGDFDFYFIKERAKKHNIEIDFLFDNLQLNHIDLSQFTKELSKTKGRPNGYFIAKDTACSKFANMYVPGKNSGAFLARLYKFGMVTQEDHIDMLMHNSIDLCATLKYYQILLQYPDFKKYYSDILDSPTSQLCSLQKYLSDPDKK